MGKEGDYKRNFRAGELPQSEEVVAPAPGWDSRWRLGLLLNLSSLATPHTGPCTALAVVQRTQCRSDRAVDLSRGSRVSA